MNGPSLATRGSQVAIAWYTEGRDGAPRVWLTRSTDAGRTFAVPRVVDEAAPIGRVDAAILADGSVVVSWVGKAEQAGELRARRFPLAGPAQEPLAIAGVDGSRRSGFPRIAALDDRVLVAWTGGGGSGLCTALLVLADR